MPWSESPKTNFELGIQAIDAIESTDDGADDEKTTYQLYRFVGDVSSGTGMIVAPASDGESMWKTTAYGEHEVGSDFELTYDTSLISKSKLEGMVGSTDDVGMTPMIVQYKIPTDSTGGRDMDPEVQDQIHYAITNESLYAFASNGEIYPMVDDASSVDSYRTYDLSDGEVESLRAQYDLADETNFEGASGEWSGLYGIQFQNYLDDLGNDLLNYIGTLMEPVINFNKTKNRKITDKQISSLHSMDTTATRVSLSVSAVDESYNEEV